ncbi:MAG: glycosyltransferase [Candidatus Hodarchaeota archaeon]
MYFQIDLVIPTLNSANTIELTLINLSKLKATGIKINIIIIDSGSNDGTIEIIKKHRFKSTYYPKGNMYAAINHGLRLGESHWCTYINSDDLFYPLEFANLLKTFYKENVDIVYGNIDYIDEEGRFLHSWNSPPAKYLHALFDSKIMPIPQPGTIFTRKIFENIGGFNERFKYSADLDFFLRAYKSKANFAKYKKGTIAAFRLHKSQITQEKKLDMERETKEIYKNVQKTTSVLFRNYARIKFRIRNILNYIIRITRWYLLYKTFAFPQTTTIINNMKNKK